MRIQLMPPNPARSLILSINTRINPHPLLPLVHVVPLPLLIPALPTTTTTVAKHPLRPLHSPQDTTSILTTPLIIHIPTALRHYQKRLKLTLVKNTANGVVFSAPVPEVL